jgi:hypothetical protein
MRRSALLLVLAFALSAASIVGGASCISTPTLPLPPPVASVSSPNAQGLVRVEGEANERAYVHVFNQQLDRGRTERADESGRFGIEIEGSVGHTLVIWQEDEGGLDGERVERVVPPQTP